MSLLTNRLFRITKGPSRTKVIGRNDLRRKREWWENDVVYSKIGVFAFQRIISISTVMILVWMQWLFFTILLISCEICKNSNKSRDKRRKVFDCDDIIIIHITSMEFIYGTRVYDRYNVISMERTVWLWRGVNIYRCSWRRGVLSVPGRFFFAAGNGICGHDEKQNGGVP